MILSRQSGVALVQVMLISALLLLLVVQLSLTAKKSVNLAIQLKAKNQASLKALNQFANAQYFLLTEERGYSLNWNNGMRLNFSGSGMQVEPGVIVRVQDLAGLLSTGFIGLEWNLLVQGDQRKLQTLKQWQGLDDNVRVSRGMRNARVPYIEEINLLNGWEDQELHMFTRLPTGFFNIATAPESLLRAVYPESTVLTILELRGSGDFTRQKFNAIDGLEDSTPFPRSNFTQVSVEASLDDDIRYSRTRIYDVQTGKSVPILEIGIETQ